VPDLNSTPPEQGWQDISTAPKDGTEFQTWVTRSTDPEGWWEPRCRYNEDGAFEIWGRVDYDQDGWDTYAHLEPTHWMPLPPPPEAAAPPPVRDVHGNLADDAFEAACLGIADATPPSGEPS
jgi:hypothetical protein